AITSGVNDTVILEKPSANITVTLSSGAYDIRKLYMREALNITGGSLTINYDPTYASDPNYPNALRSGPVSAQFSGPVTLAGSGSLSFHTLQVDAGRTFILNGGALTLNTISLMRGAAPAKIVINGDVTLNALGTGAATIVNGGSGASGSIDLAAGDRDLNISDTAGEVDFSIEVPI